MPLTRPVTRLRQYIVVSNDGTTSGVQAASVEIALRAHSQRNQAKEVVAILQADLLITPERSAAPLQFLPVFTPQKEGGRG